VQQLDEVVIESQSVTEGCTDSDWSWVCIASAELAGEPASSAGKMVGSTPAKLESCNELIHFDHEYCMTASPLGDSVEVYSEEEVIGELENQPSDVCQPNTETAILSSVCDLDLSILADPELWDNLEQIIDADQLLGLSDSPPSVTPPTAEISSQQIQFSIYQEPPKQLENDKALPIENSEGFNLNSPLYDSMDTFSGEPWSLQSSGNDFGSSSSGIGSPFSDALVDGDDYGFHWEESFIELFPALV